MSFNTRLKTILLVSAVLLLGVGMIAMPAAATEHSTELAGDGTDEVDGFAAADDEYIEHTVEADGADFGEDGTETVSIQFVADNTTYYEETADVDEGDVDYTFNVSHADLKIPGGAGETTVVTAQTVGEDADGDVATEEAEFDVEFIFDNSHAAIHAADHETDDFVTFDEASGIFSVLSSDTAEIDDTVAIDGNNTTVQVYVADPDVQDQIDSATGDAEDGDRIAPMMASTTDGELTYAFAYEPGETIAGDDVANESVGYIVVNSDDHLSITPADDAGDELNMTIVANERPDRSDLQSDLDFDLMDALGASSSLLSGLSSLIPFSLGVFFAGGFAVTRRGSLA